MITCQSVIVEAVVRFLWLFSLLKPQCIMLNQDTVGGTLYCSARFGLAVHVKTERGAQKYKTLAVICGLSQFPDTRQNS